MSQPNMQSRNLSEVREQDDNVITSIVNRDIYTLGGVYVGTASDVVLDFDNETVESLVLERDVVNQDLITVEAGKDGILFPYDYVRAVGHIILVENINPS